MIEFKSIKVTPNSRILHFTYATQKEMNMAFIRFSEFVESPRYKGKVFERDDILAYIPDYYELVLGHNIPGHKFKEFVKTYNYKLTIQEYAVNTVINQFSKLENFYLIATFRSSKSKYSAIDHETAHALYYLNENYKTEINAVLDRYNLNLEETSSYFNCMYDILDFKEYDKSVWKDEIHAFLIDLGLGSLGFFYGRDFKGSLKQLRNKKIRFHFKYKKIAKELLGIYMKYKNKL